ncbi:carbohydrate-binding protein [Pontibacter pamirensis]|uniref:hypothetical protein n=1 Tax=Pontibacter pamirensis TaxID=2562824 RepID=UPI00138A2012|nr:hypothetical protein [Pontibacter pamirensis]
MKTFSIQASIPFTLLALNSYQTQKPVESPASVGATPMWQSEAYALYPDSMVQGEHVARAFSPTHLTSSYRSPANEFQDPRITFKFAINGRDNEKASGTGEWSNWGYTNVVEVPLQQGRHTISLTFEPANENMHGEINQAMVDNMRVIKIR